MSVVTPTTEEDWPNGEKTIVHRRHLNPYKQFIEWAGDDQDRWQKLAMLALHEIADWPFSWIGNAFGITKQRAHQLQTEVVAELPQTFETDPKDLRDLAGAAGHAA